MFNGKKKQYTMTLRFIKKCFFTVMTFFSFDLHSIALNVNSLECVSMNNQKYKIRSEIINVNTVLSL